jgi:hypothetical protein
MDGHLLFRANVGKPSRIGILHFACVLLAVSILAGCELIRMRVDPSLADVPALKVEGNQWRMPTTPIRFGQWHTTEMKVGSEKTRVRGASTDKSFAERQESEQSYHFVLSTPSGMITADCVAVARFNNFGGGESAIEVDLAQRAKQPKYHCRYSGASEGTLTLTEEIKLGDPMSGELEFGADRWKVSSTAATENKLIASPGSLIGYEIRADDRVVAGVEVINGGRVWISPASSQLDQDRFAAAITALLIYREIEATAHD